MATYQVLIQERLNTIGNSGPLQIWMLQFGNYADPQGWLSFYYGKGASYNTLNYGLSKGKLGAAQQAVQQELQQADTNLNPQQRTQQYNDAELKLANDVAWLPLFQTELQVLVNPKLQNFPLSPVGLIEPDAWSKMYFVQ
ncbi:hypothetical protein EPA93_13625 [Ktedonosporobacter rubrisoli]|uniref:Solute-binding protein family 5 domain-containing protein n=1 Tax=Ktedonosporobacter rubrisoli TaxID=2509675 RepID=A0A4P6JNT2_KTERU|nr:hypothetical protein [Ktedonosporobacter rubrisoli]QBD76987.1 hypothetical protein EPA93_13625 [Ktedonosporobacter rubrisoli]